jgi:phenylpyruvate tautomerase PptA (4-oxalocrotonate tautomerase family)
MPVPQVYFPAGSLINGRKDALAQRLTDVLLTMEGGARRTGAVRLRRFHLRRFRSQTGWVR